MIKLLSLLLFCPCMADTLNVNYGLGVLKNDTSTVGFLSIGHQRALYDSLHSRFEGGVWTDSYSNRHSSPFSDISLGLHVDNNSVYAESYHGIGFIMVPDSMLGGPFQFFHSLGVGMVGTNKSMLGVEFRHISSGGIYTPNQGRNFFTMKLGFNL